MGRKAAPQPLPLADPSGGARSHDSSVSSTEFETAPSTTSSTSPPASTLTSRFAHKRPQTARTSPPVSNFETFQQIRHYSPNTREFSRQHTSPPPAAAAAESSSPPPPTAVPAPLPAPKSETKAELPQSPTTQSAVDQSPSVQQPQRAATADVKKPKGGFFHFNKSSKSQNQLPTNIHNPSEARSQMSSRSIDGPGRPKNPGSPPAGSSFEDRALHSPSQDDLQLSSNTRRDLAPMTDGRRTKAKSLGLLGRSKSNRGKDYQGLKQVHDPMPMPAPAHTHSQSNGQPLKTASSTQDRSFRDMMDSTARNRSADRVPKLGQHHEKETRAPPPATRDNGRSGTFLSGLRNSSTKAAGMISKSFFGNKSDRASEREHAVEDEHYEIHVINLPLVAQTRVTRISKRLEDSRDKTEFWMPALPWRAIDYLNYKGCEVEGLYRVPGSGPQVKKYQRKFDEFHDVNLFEEEDLYDINVVGSMLKAWLRELPDELFPKVAQERISRECAGAQEVPQMLIDELSNLSPFQYYLLFAITCHLSLLLAHSDKNKMDFRNLCICFQPCIKIDAFCFRFLVCDWKDCWKGCKNESHYIEQEYAVFEQPPPGGATQQQPTPAGTPKTTNEPLEAAPARVPQSPVSARSASPVDEHSTPNGSSKRPGKPHEPQRSPSSSSSKPSFHSAEDLPPKVKRKPLPLSTSKDSMGSKESTASTALTSNSDREPPKASVDLRRLSPIQPLSPLGF